MIVPENAPLMKLGTRVLLFGKPKWKPLGDSIDQVLFMTNPSVSMHNNNYDRVSYSRSKAKLASLNTCKLPQYCFNIATTRSYIEK